MIYRYEPTTEPVAMASDIDKLLQEPKENNNEDKVDKETLYTGDNGQQKLDIEGNPFDAVFNNTKM